MRHPGIKFQKAGFQSAFRVVVHVIWFRIEIPFIKGDHCFPYRLHTALYDSISFYLLLFYTGAKVMIAAETAIKSMQNH
jgi:hypothetical protein